MTPKLSDEQKQALAARAGQPIRVEDPDTHKLFVLMDSEEYERVIEALRAQTDLHAIRDGIEEMEAGLSMPIEEADRRLREELGFPPKVLSP